MEKYYRFAGVEIAVDIPAERMYDEDRNLAPFRVEAVGDPHRFRFTMADQLDAPTGDCIATPPGLRIYRDGKRHITYVGSVREDWRDGYLRVVHAGKEHQVQALSSAYPGKLSVKTVLNSLEVERLAALAGGVVFHCSYINVGGRAILFTAPSGVGKSTQAELWRSLRGAEIINGDRAVIRREQDRILACGIPFSGSSTYCLNRELPLAAIVYLAQAPVTSIRRVQGYEAFAKIWEGCAVNTWDPESVRRISGLVEQVAGTIPVYHLPCTPDESAVKAMENLLREGMKL